MNSVTICLHFYTHYYYFYYYFYLDNNVDFVIIRSIYFKMSLV